MTAISATPSPDAAETFDQIYATRSDSSTMRRIFEEVYGDDVAPTEADAFSFVSRSELERIVRELQLMPGQTLLDLACGAGGPGLWLAQATGASLVGIDISPEAVAQATTRAAEWGMSDRARFQVGDFVATGVPDAAECTPEFWRTRLRCWRRWARPASL